MIPMTVIRRPAPPRSGRPPISRTVMAAPDGSRYVTVRRAYSLAENFGNTGSSRVEVWVALAEKDFAPLLVRGAGRGGNLEWAAYQHVHEISDIRCHEVMHAIRLTVHAPFTGLKEQPMTIWDRRVILPDDNRFPRSKDSLRKPLWKLLQERNTCPDDEVWVIDAMIMNLAP